MALDPNITGNLLNTTRGQQFIPELWLNEIQMFRKGRMLDSGILKTWESEVKKGDTFHIPRLSELGVEDKATDTGVSTQANNDTDYVISVDTDRTAAVGIDIMLDAQSSYALRAPYLEVMGYALAKDLTGQVLGLRAALMNTAANSIFASSNGLVTGNGTALTLAALLTARRNLLENDVMDGDDLGNNLTLIISPAQETAIMNIPQFISKDFITGSPMMSGQIGTILGMNVVRTSFIQTNSLTGWRNGANSPLEPTPGVTGSRYLPRQDAFTSLPLLFTGNSAPVQTAMLVHSEWAGAVVAKKPQVTESFENREQVNLMVARQAMGCKLYRPGHGILIHTTNGIV